MLRRSAWKIAAKMRALRPPLATGGRPAAAGPGLTPPPGASPPLAPFSSAALRCLPTHSRLPPLLRGLHPAPVAAAAAAGRRAASSSRRVPPEVESYWRQVLEGVDKPTAKRLLAFIDPALPLGLADPGEGPPGRASRPPVFSYFQDTKAAHPTKVVLARVGEFFEAVGIDAVLLVQHAGLNPMGREGNPPRAGCPRANVRRAVADLVDGAGLSVVVCEEVPQGYSYGAKKKGRKERYVAAVVTPAAPHFLHGLIDEEGDVALEGAPPLLGVAPRTGGFDVIEVDAEMHTVRVSEGLTEDAVYARLHEGGLAPPLFLHVPEALRGAADQRLSEAVPEAEWERRAGAVFRTAVGAVQRYSDADPVAGMVGRVKRLLDLPADTAFRALPSASPQTRPRPLYHSTASNLGLHKTRGVPSLLDAALPPGAPLTARRWLRGLLLLPPAPEVGLAVHAACAALRDAAGPVPAFPVLSPANVVLKLRTCEANDTFFRELGELCRAVAGACGDGALEALSAAVLTAAAAETGVRLTRAQLAGACAGAYRAIHDVVDHDTELGTGRGDGGAWTDGDGDGDGSGASEWEGEAAGRGGELPPELAALGRMFAASEDFRGKIRPDKLAAAMAAVEAARARVVAEAGLCLREAAFAPLRAAKPAGKAAASRPALLYDVANNACWVRLASGAAPRAVSSSEADPDARQLIHPKDRNAKAETGVYSSAELEAAQDDYRRACAAARDAVREALRALAASLHPVLTQLVAAATFAVIACALDAHVREAARRGWALPHLAYDSKGESTGPAATLAIDGMWPYWLGGPGGIDPTTVKNSFAMDGMFLLTGPNMAGKSTLMRSTCAVALLGACGLAVPAGGATTLPYLDAFMLRNFSADSPLEGRSAFAVEMTEMRYVLADATARSLVLIDELGKGTEARAGAALAGAMLEALAAAGCRGVFATHLHTLLDLELKLPGARRMAMEVEEGAGAGAGAGGRPGRRPTWRMVEGESVESLALEVAGDCRLPEAVLSRAAGLYKVIMAAGPPEPAAAAGGLAPGVLADPAVVGVNSEPEQQGAGDISALGGPSPALRQAAALLESTAAAVLSALDASGAGREAPLPAAQYVPAGLAPPARTVGASCVYIARRPDGWFYVGSTDALQDRIKAHRRRNSANSAVADPGAEFTYVVVGPTAPGSSAAKAIEAEAIRALKGAGLGLLSEADARKRYAPIARYLNERGARYS